MYSTDTVGKLIGAIYEAPTHPQGMRSIIRPLEEALDGNVAIFARRQAAVSTVAFCSSCLPGMAAEYERTLWVGDRAMGEVADTPLGQPILDSALLADRERLKSPFYNDYLGAIGCDRGLYVPFLRNAADTILVSAQRSAKKGDYDEETALVRILAPHLARSFATWLRLKALEEEKIAAISGLRRAGLAMLLVTRTGLIVSGSEFAEAELRSDELTVANGRISAVDRRDAARLRRAIELAARAEGAESHTLQIASATGAHVTVTVAPHRSESGLALAQPLALLLFSRRAPKRIDERFMRDEYGLTGAETRLLRALVEGETLQAYAARHGVKITTVKSHLSSLFDKTGQRRQSDLIRFALDAAALA